MEICCSFAAINIYTTINMVETIQYPKYQTFFHRQEGENTNIVKCKQCGKEISENKGCICPQCGAYIGKELYQENEFLVKLVISGHVESNYEHEKGLISDEVFEERMKTLEQVAKKVKDSSKELENYHKSKYEATDKLGKFHNSLLFRFTNAYYSFVYGLARPASKGYDAPDGIDLGYSIVFGIFGAFLLFGATNAKGFGAVLLALIGLFFVLVPIIAVMERILGNKPNENEFLKHWTYWKHAIHSRLWGYFSKKSYQELDLREYYLSGFKDLVEYYKNLNNNPHDKDELLLMADVFNLMIYQCILIRDDYLISIGEEGDKSIDKCKKLWRDLNEKYEV